MARILLGVAILLTLVSGFFSLKTKSKFGGIREELSAAQAASANAQSQVSKAKEEAKAVQEQLTAANSAKDSAEAEANTAKAEADKAKGELASVQGQVAAKDAELEELKAKIAAPAETPAPTGPDPVELERQLKEAQTKLEEQAQVAKSLEEQSKEANQRAAALEAERTRRQRGISAPGLEGTILAVNGSWNFVVLNIGDRQGVAPNSTLLVKRGTKLIGKLRVTSVDPSTAIADIVPGSIAKGAYVRPGDVVIFSSNTGTPATAPAPAPDVPALPATPMGS